MEPTTHWNLLVAHYLWWFDYRPGDHRGRGGQTILVCPSLTLRLAMLPLRTALQGHCSGSSQGRDFDSYSIETFLDKHKFATRAGRATGKKYIMRGVS